MNRNILKGYGNILTRWRQTVAIALITLLLVLGLGDRTRAMASLFWSPVIESPVVESPVVESPVIESPVIKSPVVDLAGPMQPISQTRQFCPDSLSRAIGATLAAPEFGTAQWGVWIETLADQRILYQHNAHRSLIPASNIKLLTTAAALQIVGDRRPQDLANLESWLIVVNRDSHNGYADDLLQRIGGQHAVRQALIPLGVDPNSYTQADGSGLSRQNQATPATFVALLKGISVHPNGELFYRSLPIAGVSGTLRNRFRTSAVQGRVHAKTGTLRGVRALSGYLETPHYGTLAFSILVNQPGQSGQVLIQAIDQIVGLMAQVTPCR